MGILDGDISALFGEVFGQFYLDGTVTHVALVDDGEGGYTETPSTEAAKIQQDACTDAQKLEAGYSSHDVRLLILQASLDGLVKNGDRATVLGKTWIIGPTITTDPANSYFECRGIPA